MGKTSKRFAAARKLVEPGKSYELKQALALIKQMPQTKFDAAVELHLNLGVDVKQANQQVRGSVVLPHGTGKAKRIAVFCNEDKAKDAKAAGATLVGGAELIKEIQQTGKCDFDVAIATPDMMKLLAPIAKTLGQKGLMPNPKTETIVADVGKAVEALSKGKVSFKTDDTGNMHQSIGRVSYDTEKLTENATTFLDAVKRVKPASTKGTYIRKAVVCTSMGPAVPVMVN
jgi:large subunit ribosomal protein L1